MRALRAQLASYMPQLAQPPQTCSEQRAPDRRRHAHAHAHMAPPPPSLAVQATPAASQCVIVNLKLHDDGGDGSGTTATTAFRLWGAAQRTQIKPAEMNEDAEWVDPFAA